MLTKECAQEIGIYVTQQGWVSDGHSIFRGVDYNISRSYFIECKKGLHRDIEKVFNKNNHLFDRYFLEFIGHILRKHNITTVRMNYF